MKKNVKTKIMGTVLAALCAVSTVAAASTFGTVSAATAPTASVASNAQYGKDCKMHFDDIYNWTFSLFEDNVSITCDADWSTNECTFYAHGNYEGTADAILMTQRADGRWNNTPVRFTVDSNLNVTGQATGRTYITDNV